MREGGRDQSSAAAMMYANHRACAPGVRTERRVAGSVGGVRWLAVVPWRSGRARRQPRPDLRAVQVAADVRGVFSESLARGVAVPVQPRAGDRSFPEIHSLLVGDVHLLLAFGLACAARRNERPCREADHNIDGQGLCASRRSDDVTLHHVRVTVGGIGYPERESDGAVRRRPAAGV
jgi:hypothetical protein